jgi:hypothetical protein
MLCHWKPNAIVLVSYKTVVDAQTCAVGMTLAPLDIWFCHDVCKTLENENIGSGKYTYILINSQ